MGTVGLDTVEAHLPGAPGGSGECTRDPVELVLSGRSRPCLFRGGNWLSVRRVARLEEL